MDLLVRRRAYVVNANIHDAISEHAIFHGTLLVLPVKDPAEILHLIRRPRLRSRRLPAV
jgi:hypothetical protein